MLNTKLGNKSEYLQLVKIFTQEKRVRSRINYHLEFEQHHNAQIHDIKFSQDYHSHTLNHNFLEINPEGLRVRHHVTLTGNTFGTLGDL